MNSTRRGWDLADALLAAGLLGSAWRLQDLFPVIGALKPLMLVTGGFVIILLLDRRLPTEFARAALRPPGVLAVALLMLAFIGVPFSLYPGMSLTIGVKELLPAIILMLGIAAAIEGPGDAIRFAGMQVVGAFVFSAFVLTHFQIGPDGRLGDLVYYDANGLGLVLVCTLPLAEWVVTHGRRLVTRVAAATAILLFLVTIVRTGSRGAFLGLISVVAYGIFASRSASRIRRLVPAALAATLLIAAAGTQYWKTIDTILHPTKDYNWVGNSDTGRMSVWKRGIGYMLDRPITGVGAGAFPVAEGTLSKLAQRQNYGVGLKWSAAHNSFVEVGAELGIPGLLVFVALLVGAGLTARRATRLALANGDLAAAALGDALAAALVGYAVSGFFLSEAFLAYYYSIVGIIIGLERSVSLAALSTQPLPVEPEPAHVPEATLRSWPEWTADARSDGR